MYHHITVKDTEALQKAILLTPGWLLSYIVTKDSTLPVVIHGGWLTTRSTPWISLCS